MPQVHHQTASECDRSLAVCQEPELRGGGAFGEFPKEHFLPDALPRGQGPVIDSRTGNSLLNDGRPVRGR